MSDRPDPLREFQRRMGTAAQVAPGASADLLLEVMESGAAKLLRLCAIPHQFDADIAQTLAPGLERVEIQQHCEDFARLSFVSADAGGWALHDGVRRHFFSQWLMAQSAEEFADASGRLAAFFKERAERSQGGRAETARRRSMFHLLGSDQESGFREFDLLLRRARHNRLYSECSQLIRLVHEYDGVLASRYRLWLTYHEAKLSADLRDLEGAETGYQQVLDDPESLPELRSEAYVGLGYVHIGRRNWDEAIRCYERGLALAEKAEGMRYALPRILQDLGAALRDRGDLERAEVLLNRSVELAQEQHDLSSLAAAYNSLGTLALRRREVDAAIDAFEKSLDALVRNEDQFGTAQVYNNLGLAYADLPDWVRSDEYFRKSLDIKLRAGDTLGQATALNNIARVQASRGDLKAAIDSYTRAIALFTEMRDLYRATLVKHNRGKLLRRINERERAHKDFTEAMEAFRALGKASEADAAAQDLQASGDRGGSRRREAVADHANQPSIVLRLGAGIAGALVLLVVSVFTLGTALAAPLGLWVIRSFMRRRGRNLSRLQSWSTAVAFTTAALLVVFLLVSLLAGTSTEATPPVRAAEPAPQPEWLKRMEQLYGRPNAAVEQAVEQIIKSGPVTFYFGLLVIGFACAILGTIAGSIGWGAIMLIGFGLYGFWPFEDSRPSTVQL